MDPKNQCYKCNGLGLVETDFIKCGNCDGRKCFICRGTGILQYAWSECPRCLGNGIDCNETVIYDRVKLINGKNLTIKKNKSI